MSQGEINKVFRQSYAELGLHFFANNLHRRFTVAHGWRVNYSFRTRKYRQRKEKELGHNQPFTYSGDTKTRAASLSYVGIFATATKGQGKTWLTVNAPALNYHPQYRVEFERVGDYELPPLERFVEKKAEKFFNESTETSTETI